MPRLQGLSKTGGRRKGTPNKTTQGLQQALEGMNLNILEQICQLLPHLSVDKRVDVLLHLMAYIYPKRKSLDQISTIGPNSFVELILSLENDLDESA